jgi:hypothetical protein
MAAWTSVIRLRALPLFRFSEWDAVFVGLSIVQAAVVVAFPSIPLIALGLWWNANTIAHNFIHRPFFRSNALNGVYSAWLTMVMGVPQSIWRERHLAHHADRAPRVQLTRAVAIDIVLLAALWLVLGLTMPRVWLLTYLPGIAIGLVLCQLQGHYEHAGGTTSHYGRLYNLLLFNDGYHVEHHARPGVHWSELPARAAPGARYSRWPPVLRWLDAFGLQGLERVVLRSPALQRFVLDRHERAFRKLASHLTDVSDVLVIGGGLFPRTALVVQRILPAARLTIVDATDAHLTTARTFLDDSTVLRHGIVDAASPMDADLVIVPLAFIGDRSAFYAHPPARTVLVHDWIWARKGHSAIVSWLLLKRLNLVTEELSTTLSTSRT